jgi:hypothetical protein
MKLKTLIVLALAFAIASLGASASFAQSAAPKGMRRATPAEASSIFAQAKSLDRTEVNPTGRDTTAAEKPQFAIRVTGNSRSGISATARNTAVIKAGTIVFGQRIDVFGNATSLWPMYASEDLQPGWIYYDLDLSRVATYNEAGGTIEYRMVAIGSDGTKVSYADKMFNTNGDESHLIKSGNSTNQAGSSPTFILIGNFGPKVGVAIKNLDGEMEYAVPNAAINLGGNKLVIDTSKFDYTYLPSGDYTITVAAASGQSDTIVVRLNPTGQ